MAAPNLQTLAINRVVAHEIPQVPMAKKHEHKPLVSDQPVVLSSDVRTYIRERIIEAFASSTFTARPKVEVGDGAKDDAAASPVPQLVVDYFADQETFVPMSQESTHYLYEGQGGKASAGMLLFVDATVGSGKQVGNVLVILKLEKSGALVIDPVKRPDGSQTFDVRLQDIALDKRARVFKVALFRRATDVAGLRPHVSDHQHDERQFGDEVARFFLDFIGCELESTPERDTKAVLEHITDFAETIEDPLVRTRFIVGAMGDLSSNSPTVDPLNIAKNHLPPQQQDEFIDKFRIDASNVQTFLKDTRLINAKLGRLVAEFDGKIRVTGPADVLNEVLEQDGDGTWTINAPLEYIGPPGRKR